MITHPILFQGDMVRALLEGRKTQTRRALKPPFEVHANGAITKPVKNPWGGVERFSPYSCPYGQPGDLLWVRETFVIENTIEYHGDISFYGGLADYEGKFSDRPIQKIEEGHPDWNYDWGDHWLIPHFRATEPEPNIVTSEQEEHDDRTRWKPSIFMPRWASRLTLKITDVRVERVQDISNEDAEAEGVDSKLEVFPDKHGAPDEEYWIYRDYLCKENSLPFDEARESYQSLWNSINNNWKDNPWVWVVEFKVIHKNVDEVIQS